MWAHLGSLEAGRSESRAYFSAEPPDDPAWAVAHFARHWTVEVMFEGSRAHPGAEMQRQWLDRSIGRETPCLLGLDSAVAWLTRSDLQAYLDAYSEMMGALEAPEGPYPFIARRRNGVLIGDRA